MAKKDVGNTAGPSSDVVVDDQTGDAEFDALFEEITEEFGAGEEAFGDDFDALNAALVGTEFEVPSTESADVSRLYDIADGTVAESGTAGEAELFGFVRRRFEKRAKQAMRALLRKVKSARKYAKCIPAVIKVVKAVKARRWGTAIREALRAWRCLRRA